MTQIQDQNTGEKETYREPSPGRFQNTSRALTERVARENAGSPPGTRPEEVGLDECMTATYWG